MSTLALNQIQQARQNHATFLDLGNCGLTELPDGLFELTWLEGLNLGTYYYDKEIRRWIKSVNNGSVNNLAAAHLIKLVELGQLQTLDLSYTGITDIGALAELGQLQTLDLSNTGISDIGALAELGQLQTLHLSDNRNLTDIGVLAKLSQLQTLDLRGTGISDIGVLAELGQLQTLDLSYTGISDIGVLAELGQLQTLHLSYTGISDIGVLAELGQLQTLHLRSTGITDIGVLAELGQLQTLDLRGTGITDIGVLAELGQLQTLDMSDNHNLTDIGVLAELGQLQTLYLRGTGITDIGVLAKLGQLQTLDLRNTGISDIGALAELGQLQALHLSYTGISDIGALAELGQLQTLHLSNTGISDIGALAELGQLQTLHLSDNRNLTDIGVLAKLSQLQTLDLRGTGISDIGVLAELGQLQTLDLSYTGISDIGVLAELGQLQTLDLRGTGITDIGVLAELGQLQTLDLSNTGISDIGVLAELGQLQTLHLSDNRNLTDIGALAELSQLQTLDLRGTGITDISSLRSFIQAGLDVKWSDKYWEGSGIYVKECLLTTPPVSIVQEGNEAILNFFRQIDEQGGTIPLYEAKLIMVGEPGAGKTSLTEKLLDENHQVIVDDPKKKSTLGINVRDNWRFTDCLRPEESFTAHIWDFGGQEIQYMTHQFFLTPESLYVLVADDRKQHTLFPYWFEVIQLLGKDESERNSPVLVVLNERNHKSISNFDLNEYRRKYPGMQIDVLEVDLSDSNLSRFKLVRDKVQHLLCSLDHVGRQLPKKWPEIRKAIIKRTNTQNHISEQEFAEICARSNVTRAEDRQLISKYLHQLGVILHFQNDRRLRDFIIINPTWALKAVYAVLEDKEVNRRHGRFTETDLDRYWENLTAEERIKILGLMEKDSFEICYPVGSQAYIAPQLLADKRPNFDWNSHESLKFHFFYRFMPKGIMTRLIVRKHEDLKNEVMVWARGAVFHRFGCNMLVTEEETERNGLIAIEVSGPASSRIRALNFIRDAVEDIHKKWFSNIEYEERVPCNCNDCAGTLSPTFFSWPSLSKYVEQNIKTINCENGRIKGVPVIPLLEGIYDQERINMIHRARRERVNLDVYPFSNDTPDRSPKTEKSAVVSDKKEPPKEEVVIIDKEPDNPPTIFDKMKTNSWQVAIIAAVVAVLFFAFASANSELDFLGLFHAKKGQDVSTQKPETFLKPETPTMATIIGSIKINNRNARAEDVEQVSIKDQTAGPRATLDNNTFTLRGVKIPEDRLITITINLSGGRYSSQMRDLPKANGNNVIDLGEVLLFTQADKAPTKTGRRNGPSIIINNQNNQQTN